MKHLDGASPRCCGIVIYFSMASWEARTTKFDTDSIIEGEEMRGKLRLENDGNMVGDDTAERRRDANGP